MLFSYLLWNLCIEAANKNSNESEIIDERVERWQLTGIMRMLPSKIMPVKWSWPSIWKANRRRDGASVSGDLVIWVPEPRAGLIPAPRVSFSPSSEEEVRRRTSRRSYRLIYTWRYRAAVLRALQAYMAWRNAARCELATCCCQRATPSYKRSINSAAWDRNNWQSAE